MIKKIMLILIMLMILSTINYMAVVTANGNSDYTDEFDYYTPTIDEDFDDDTVIVTLKSAYSEVNGDISINDFLSNDILYIDYIDENDIFNILEHSIIIESVRDMSYIEDPRLIKDRANFCQILSFDLLNEDKCDVLIAINEFKKLEIVLAAEPSYNYNIVEDVVPNDLLYSNQWGLNWVNGIDAELAWNFSFGNTNPLIKVGIFESNIQFDHPDLRIIPGSFTPSSSANADHGTHVAGIIGATANNSIGVAGVTQVEIALLDPANFTDSLIWAFNNGIRIVNASFSYENFWGSPSPANVSHANAIRIFSNNSGILITSAGNNGDTSNGNTDNTPQFPAGYGDSRNFPDIINVISVGSINSNGSRSSFSNYGINSVHIYAPGRNILSTFPESNWGIDIPNYDQVARGYALTSGTSMAAPHVAGVAALLLSIKPDLTVTDLKHAILNSAETISITIPDGTTQNVKKLNAFNAIKYIISRKSSFLTLKYNNKTISKTIDGTSSYFMEKNAIIKLSVQSSYNYRFSVSSSNPINVTLYDDDFNVLSITPTYLDENCKIDFSKYLSLGGYYLKINFNNEGISGSVNATIYGPPHTHTYDNWVYYSKFEHIEVCDCHETGTRRGAHIVRSSDIINNKANCLECMHLLDLNIDIAMIIKNNTNIKYSINGSYILPNGIVILMDEDIDAYFAGTLIFYDKDQLPQLE